MMHPDFSGAFRSWLWMMKRCIDPLDPAYAQYGGAEKGVCDRWIDYRNFLADMGPRPEGWSLDRRDNDKGYSPENCRWASAVTQSRNRSCARIHSHEGEQINQSEVARRVGVADSTIYRRAQAGKAVAERRWFRLTPSQAREIRRAAVCPSDDAAVAQQYGISRQAVSAIRRGKAWT